MGEVVGCFVQMRQIILTLTTNCMNPNAIILDLHYSTTYATD